MMKLLSVSVLVLTSLVSNSVHADFVIDDFDTEGFVHSSGPTQIEQEGAALIAGIRTLTSRGLNGAVGEWRADSSLTEESVFHMSASDLEVGQGYGINSSGYSFVEGNIAREIDFTAGGQYDGIRLDFSYSRGPTPVRNIIIAAATDGALLTVEGDPLPETEEPFSVDIPFASFVVRGDLPPGGWFSVIRIFQVNFLSSGNSRFPLHDDVGWEVGLDRISLVDLPDPVSCDLNADGSCDIVDIDLMHQLGDLSAGVEEADFYPLFDMNSDGIINLLDRDVWLREAAIENGLTSPYLRGDSNLDGFVEVSDFNVWNTNKFTNRRLWSSGNFDGDLVVDSSDFNAWNDNKFQSSGLTSPVPEPSSNMLLATLLLLLFLQRHQRRRTE